MPCAQAAEAWAFLSGVTVSAATVRRTTEGAGAAYEAGQTTEVAAIEPQVPAVPPGPRVQWLSVDGAMVPVRPQAWAEVKTLAIGTVGGPVRERGDWVVHTEERSYCSRLAAAETFGRLALVATHRRGTETARTVCAVSDGAEWIQGCVDFHRPDAVRILDFPHAVSDVAQAGHAVYGEGTAAFTQWFTVQRQALRHGDPGEVLQALRRLATTAKRRQAKAATPTVQESLGYLATRRGRLDYAWFDARGFPIGRGSVESANTLVVERRLKGAGMPWARAHVNPMVALRAMACSARWQEAWPQLAQQVRQQVWQGRRQRQRARRQAKTPAPVPTLSPPPPAALSMAPAGEALPAPRHAPSPQPVVPQVAPGPYRPPSDHPWRRVPLRWKNTQQTKRVAVAKL